MALAVLALVCPTAADAAVDVPLVSDNPVDYTPRVIGGWVGDPVLPYRTVIDFATIGDFLYAGGVIDQVADANGATLATKFSNLMRFDATTGVVDESFHPRFKGVDGGDGKIINGVVNALVASPDGRFLYVGGEFTTVGGKVRTGLAKWNVSKNKLAKGFDAQLGTDGNTGKVYDLQYAHGQLLVGTSSTEANGVLLSVDPATGARTEYASVDVASKVRDDGGSPRVYKIAVSPDESRAMIIGNFRQVAGAERLQVAMLDLGTEGVELAPWYARDVMAATTPPASGPITETSCRTVRDWCLMDVDWSPDGTWFAIAASGGPGLTYPSIKDAISRWEVNDNDNNFPTWVNYSDGDTFHSVRATTTNVYAGGHFRWLNGQVVVNGVVQDAPREMHHGLGAIDSTSGLAVSDWNEGDSTTRGEGWRGMLVSPGLGLWVGGDTNLIQGEPRNRLGLLPLP